MKKISLTKKQKDFLKKIGIVAGIAGAGAIGFKILNRSELGYKLKYAWIKKLSDSIISDNGYFFFVHAVGDGKYYTQENITEALNGLAKIVDEISASKGLPSLSKA